MRSLLVFLGFLPFLSFAQNNKAHVGKEIDKIINYDTDIDVDEMASFILGVKIQDSMYVYSYGSVEKRGSIAPHKNHIFEIGGLTKPFTALLTGILADEGLISLDSSLNSYLLPIYRNPKTATITIKDLVNHTTSLPLLPRGIGRKEKDKGNPFGHYSKDDLLDFYKDYIPEIKEDESYKYSHTNYAMLEIVLEEITGSSYDLLLKKYIFDPLEMYQTGVHNFSSSNTENIVQGHGLAGYPTKPWSMSSFAGSEGIRSSLEDLFKYMDANIYPERYASLDSIIVDQQIPYIKTKIVKKTFGAKGWLIEKQNSNIVFHPGKTTGFRSFMGFVPETETGVIILSNNATTMGNLGLLILRMINNNWKKRSRIRRSKS